MNFLTINHLIYLCIAFLFLVKRIFVCRAVLINVSVIIERFKVKFSIYSSNVYRNGLISTRVNCGKP